MKKLSVILGIILIIISVSLKVNAESNSEKFTLEFEMENVGENEEYKLYLLLPKQYILHAIENDSLNIEYNGAQTLKDYIIPSINVNEEDVQDELYIEDNVEYIQILLNKNDDGIYKFDILSNYGQMDMKYRLVGGQKNYIVHIDNFKIDNGVCSIIYDYSKDEVKQPNKIYFDITKPLIILLVIIIVVGVIAYIKKKSNN